MNITFPSKIDSEPTTFASQSGSSSAIKDFSEARHQLTLASRHVARDKAARAVKNSTGQHKALAGASELVEEAVYWFLTAPALVYVIYSAFGF
jgi:hypothetical protein